MVKQAAEERFRQEIMQLKFMQETLSRWEEL